MNATARANEVWRRPRWIVVELDARGEIDAHAAMCLQQAIEAAGASAIVLVDLRDLTSINAAGLDLFVRADEGCRSSGMQLGLLISGHERHDAIVAAFNSAGLVDQLQFTWEPRGSLTIVTGVGASAPLPPYAERLRTAARRFAVARFRRSDSA